MKPKTNRLSPAGRKACSASGKRNVQRALETSHAAIPALRAACSEFDALLDAETGDKPTAVKRGSKLAASASFAAIFIVREKLLAARRFKRIETLIEQLTPLQGALARSLRALGVEPSGSNPDPMAALRKIEAEIVAARTPAAESEAADVEASET